MKKTIASVCFLLALAGCSKNAQPPVTPPTPTVTAIKAVAELSASNLAALQAVVAAHKLGKIGDATFAQLKPYFATVDSVCYQSAPILKSASTDAAKYTQLSGLAASIIIPQVAAPDAQVQLTQLSASIVVFIQAFQGLKP